MNAGLGSQGSCMVPLESHATPLDPPKRGNLTEEIAKEEGWKDFLKSQEVYEICSIIIDTFQWTVFNPIKALEGTGKSLSLSWLEGNYWWENLIEANALPQRIPEQPWTSNVALLRCQQDSLCLSKCLLLLLLLSHFSHVRLCATP